MAGRGVVRPGLPHPTPTASYWRNPIIPLQQDEHENTPLPDYVETVIIGSGICGASIAYHLLRRSSGTDILMLEARKEASNGATGRNGGHTKAASHRNFSTHLERFGFEEAIRIARLEYEDIRATHSLAAELGIECESRSCRTVDVYYDLQKFRVACGLVRTLQGHFEAGDPVADYVIYDDPETVREKFLTGGDDVIGAVEYGAGSISAYRFTMGLLEWCSRQGSKFEIRTGSPVMSIEPYQPIKAEETSKTTGQTAPLYPKARWVLTVGAEGVKVLCRNVVLATNAYTPYLLPAFQNKIIPLRGQVIAQRPGSKLTRLRPTGLAHTYSLVYKTGYEYMIQRPYDDAGVPQGHGGDLVIGGGLGILDDKALGGEYGNTDDSELNGEVSVYLRKSLKRYFAPNWADAAGDDETQKKLDGNDDGDDDGTHEWTGIMAITPDGLPFVGPVTQHATSTHNPINESTTEPNTEGGEGTLSRTTAESGLWLAAGFNGHGMVLCLKSAEALVQMMVPGSSGAAEPDWFPRSFLPTEERLKALDGDTGKGDGRIDGRKRLEVR